MASKNITESGTALKMASRELFDIIMAFSLSSEISLVLGGAALVVAVISYLVFIGSTPITSSSTKYQKARAMREAYNSMNKKVISLHGKNTKVSAASGIHSTSQANS
jgi:hypothetical protein